MTTTGHNSILKMDDTSFERLSKYITSEFGIKLPIVKKSMLESRLNKKVKSLGLETYSRFLDHIFNENGRNDLLDVVDLITTNKTDFFREAAHFHFLTNNFLPNFPSNNLNIWSAGCSTGEEPYTIIMALEEYKKKNVNLSYDILASDISLRVIQSAYNGIYSIDRLTEISNEMKKTYFLKSKSNPAVARIKPIYRKKIKFKRINLMDNQFGINKTGFDVIFCRNVLIYFNKETQENVIRKLCKYLKPGGILFLGHSESIMGMNLPLKQLQPTTYQLI